MKFSLLSVLIVFLAFESHAQRFQIAGKIGAHTMDISQKEFIDSLTTSGSSFKTALKEANYGFHGGFAARFTMKKFYISPELLIASKKINYSWEDVNDPSNRRDYSFDIYDLDIPIAIGYDMGIIRLQGGVVGNVLISGWSDLAGELGGMEQYRTGYQYGVGADIGRFILDVRYEGSLSGFGDELKIGGKTYVFDSRPSRLMLSIGYNLNTPLD